MPLNANRLASRFECLNTVEEFRGRCGRRYPLATGSAIATAPKLAVDAAHRHRKLLGDHLDSLHDQGLLANQQWDRLGPA